MAMHTTADKRLPGFKIMPANDLVTEAQVAQALQEGRTVEPEFYQCVTIFFSDIVGFTSISGILQPHEVSPCVAPAASAWSSCSWAVAAVS